MMIGKDGQLQESATLQDMKLKYAFDYIDLNTLFGLLVLAAFVWPVFFVTTYFLSRSTTVHIAQLAAEALLCAWSVYVIYNLGSLGKRMIGGYLGIVAAVAYFLAIVSDIGVLLSDKKSKT